jgi:hypothetical protein
MHLCNVLLIYGAQVVQGILGPHKSMCEWCTYLEGGVLQLDPLRLIRLFEYTWCSLKGELKGKGELGPCKDFHCTTVLVYLIPSSFLCSYCLLLLIDNFWWGNGVKGQKMIQFWCLMPKGEKLRPKQRDQLPLENFENSRVRILIWPKCSYCAILSLVGEKLWLWEKDYGKRRVFGTRSIFPLEYLSLCLNKCAWLRDMKMNLIFKNKPSGGKEWSKYAKLESKQFCIDVALICVAFWCVGINH